MSVEQKIKLGGLKVIFANLVDEGFGRSITIDATEDKIKTAITKWVAENNIGKAGNAGKPNFKEYEKDGNKTIQYSFKLNDYSKIAGLNGLDEKSLGYGATIALIAQAFEYDNKFGKGTSASVSAVLIERGASTGADSDLADLLSEHGEQPTDSDQADTMSINDQPGEFDKDLKVAKAIFSDDVIVEDFDDEKPISLEDIPF